MKNTIFSFLTAAGLLFAGCHQPDELLPSVSRNGINSVTAQFVKGSRILRRIQRISGGGQR